MFFALGMERVEARLRQVVVGENDVEEFLEQARPNEVLELFRHGIGRAIELFRVRRPGGSGHAAARRSGPRPATLAITNGQRDTDFPTMPIGEPITQPIMRRDIDGIPAQQSRAS